MQDLWQAHYQIIKLNKNMDTMIKNVKLTELIKYKYCNCFLEYTNFKDSLIEYKCLCSNKIYQQMFDEKLKKQF